VKTLGQPARFVLVGAGGYAANLALFAALYSLGTAYLAASVTAYFASNGFMYVGNRYFTFELGRDGSLSAYGRYVLVGAVVAALNAVLLVAVVETAAVEPPLGQGVALAAMTPVAFLLNKRWTFRIRHDPSACSSGVPRVKTRVAPVVGERQPS
jgi:putative flippase GtrA